MGATMRNRLHFSPHLLARCAIITKGGPNGYLRALRETHGVPQEIVEFTERQLKRITDGGCPYEAAADACSPYNPEGATRAEEFLRQGLWPSAQMRSDIEMESVLLDALGRLGTEEGRG